MVKLILLQCLGMCLLSRTVTLILLRQSRPGYKNLCFFPAFLCPFYFIYKWHVVLVTGHPYQWLSRAPTPPNDPWPRERVRWMTAHTHPYSINTQTQRAWFYAYERQRVEIRYWDDFVVWGFVPVLTSTLPLISLSPAAAPKCNKETVTRGHDELTPPRNTVGLCTSSKAASGSKTRWLRELNTLQLKKTHAHLTTYLSYFAHRKHSLIMLKVMQNIGAN